MIIGTNEARSKTRIISPQPPTFAVRVVAGIAKRLRLQYYRLIHWRASFGTRVDIRSGFRLRMGINGKVKVGAGCILDNDLTIECHGDLQIGDRTVFGHHCTIGVVDQVVIGSDCLIAEMVSIRDHDHCFERIDVPVREQGLLATPVRIGNNVWIGGKATVVRGIDIGDNCVIGANSVVTHSVPANSIAVGAPARVIRVRD